MIRYALQCEKGHEFDGWFSNSDAYDTQVARHLVECVVCGSVTIENQIAKPKVQFPCWPAQLTRVRKP
jgi:hypothetical protein